MVRSVPRASAGFRRFAASPVPAAPPAPIRVCASSMKRMIGLAEACTSSMTERSRFSNSPFMLAPAWSRPMSSTQSCTSLSDGGTSPFAIRSAKPSATAVFPTPASPVRIGLFWRRRIRISTTWRISSSRPVTGSMPPARARAVRSEAKRRSASCLPIAAGGMAWLASPGVPGANPSLATCPSSGEPLTMRAKSSVSVSTLTFSNSPEIRVSTLRRRSFFRSPTRR